MYRLQWSWDLTLLERCPHFRGCYVQASVELVLKEMHHNGDSEFTPKIPRSLGMVGPPDVSDRSIHIQRTVWVNVVSWSTYL